MKKLTNNKKQFVEKYFLCFMMYAVIGWCYEVFIEVFVKGWGFSNRGVLFGPYCPIYGVGALTFLLLFGRLMRSDAAPCQKLLRLFMIFLGCMTAATVIELAASYILEFATGAWPWQTYAEYKINFEARIALSTSVRFGLGGVLFLYVIQPLFNRLLARLSKRSLAIASSLTACVVCADTVCTLVIR